MKTVFKILVSFLLLSIVWLFMSCGARKVHKQSSKEEIKTESVDNSVIEKQFESNIKTKTTIKVDDKNEIASKEDIYEPIDPTKEAYVIDENGKKTVLNNSKKTSKTISQKNDISTVKDYFTVEMQKEAIKEQKTVKQVNVSKKENSSKEVKKEQFKPFNLVIIIAIFLFIIYLVYRVYKKLPLLPKF